MSQKIINPCPNCGQQLGTGQAPANCKNAGHFISATDTGPAADLAAKLQQHSAQLGKSQAGTK